MGSDRNMYRELASLTVLPKIADNERKLDKVEWNPTLCFEIYPRLITLQNKLGERRLDFGDSTDGIVRQVK
jgi:hypothetical protein